MFPHERRQQSLRDYYDEQVDEIINRALDHATLKRLTSSANAELADAPEFSAETIDDLRMYCQNFCQLVITLSELDFIEKRMWTKNSAETLIQAMIDKIGSE
ncbi:hypothetical protein HY949_00415 [Candidatus Gottesmanbacteria bacterium]|nr:hypothetical protein [Candidatus Gottesmanbacteria bacterium]